MADFKEFITQTFPKIDKEKAIGEKNVRNWVKANYPKEFQADLIKENMTFDDLYDEMKKGGDFYRYASEDGDGFDSAVREEIFEGLSRYHKKPYDHFYNLWLKGE